MGKKHKQEETEQVKDEGSNECRLGKKHKKQKVKEDASITTEDPGTLSLSACSVRTEKKKKRKRKGDSEDMDSLSVKTRKLAEETLNSTLDTSPTSQEPEEDGSATLKLDQETKTRKKKKKRLSDDLALPSPAERGAVKTSEKDQEDEKEVGDVSEAGSKSSTKKERKGHGLTEQLSENADSVKSEKKKKKCKKSKHSENCEHDVENGFNSGVAEPVEKKKRRKNKMVFDGSEDGDISSVNCSTGDLEHVNGDGTKKAKRKKEKKKKKRDEHEDGTSGEQSETLEDTSEPAAQAKHKDRKKKCKEAAHANRSVAVTPLALLQNGSEEAGKKKKKKDKKKKKQTEEEVSEDNVISGDCGDAGKKVDTNKSSKKKKEKKSEKAPGNEGPSTLDRQDVGNAANSKTPPEEQQSAHKETQQAQSAYLGQWSTNMFKSTERQNKFLRLLGGFKKAGGEGTNSQKGLFGSLQAKADSSFGGQRALSYQGARDMNRRLESDFERALSFRAKSQRGVGLGFTPDPAEGKKFHIDINKTASTKFH